jgi:hypothetical protein
MAKSGRLQDKANEYGESLDILIPRLLNKLGTMYLVARELDVYPNTILHWLSTHKYYYDSNKKIWVKESEVQEPHTAA